MTADPKIVTLRTGVPEQDTLIRSVYIALARLQASTPIVLHELAEASRNAGHAMFGKTGSIAMAAGLLESQHFDGRVSMHGSVRNIVMAATSVTGDDVRLLPLSEVAPSA